MLQRLLNVILLVVLIFPGSALARPRSNALGRPAVSEGQTASKGDASAARPSRAANTTPGLAASSAITTMVYLPLVHGALDMTYIPAGAFQMGCDPAHNDSSGCNRHEEPLHTVYLDAYFMDRYEVTNAQYGECVVARSCTIPYTTTSAIRSAYYGDPVYANYPVIHVDWNQAAAYCAWAGKRLPSEAEWEKAARGASDARVYPWGDQRPHCAQANFFDINFCIADTSPVGSYPGGASAYGIMDMAGNVWEWVNDWYDYSYYGASPASNPPGPLTGTWKVARGGSWTNDVYFLRVSQRIAERTTTQSNLFGIRCAR